MSDLFRHTEYLQVLLYRSHFSLEVSDLCRHTEYLQVLLYRSHCRLEVSNLFRHSEYLQVLLYWSHCRLEVICVDIPNTYKSSCSSTCPSVLRALTRSFDMNMAFRMACGTQHIPIRYAMRLVN